MSKLSVQELIKEYEETMSFEMTEREKIIFKQGYVIGKLGIDKGPDNDTDLEQIEKLCKETINKVSLEQSVIVQPIINKINDLKAGRK